MTITELCILCITERAIEFDLCAACLRECHWPTDPPWGPLMTPTQATTPFPVHLSDPGWLSVSASTRFSVEVDHEHVPHLDSLADVLAPSLPGAACRDEWQLFDRTINGPAGARPEVVQNAREQALALCRQCPALTRCRDWYTALPADQRPLGVVAGQLSSRRPLGYKQ